MFILRKGQRKKVVLSSNVRDAAQRARKLEFSTLSRKGTHPGYCQTCRIGRASLTPVQSTLAVFSPTQHNTAWRGDSGHSRMMF